LVAVGAIALIALVLADFATYSALRSSLYKQVDQSFTQSSLRVERFLNEDACQTPNSSVFGGGPPQGGGNDTSGGFGSIPFIEVRTSPTAVLAKCRAYVGSQADSPALPSRLAVPASANSNKKSPGPPAYYFTVGSIRSGGPIFRVQVSEVPLTNRITGAKRQGLAVVAEPIGGTLNTLHTLFLIELAVTAGALVLALTGGWWLVRLGLRPLEDVERTADSIAAGNLDQRVPGADDATEVGRLARAINVMLERIEAAFSARVASEARLKESDRHLRQFVADASHELRTPIAAVSAYAELFERGGSQHAEDLPRIVSGIRNETARMDRLVSDLLTLARLDEGVPMEMAPVELVGLASEAVRTAAAVGPDWPVQFSAARPVEVIGDKDRLRQVLDNLLANVRAHTPPGTSATVHVDQIGGQAQIVVRDTGPGMPEEDAPRVFERFFRADPARTRTRGGSGLGLSIVSAIVAAHGGTVTATSKPGEGLVVTVLMPVTSVQPGVEPLAAVAPPSSPA
jgi:signal transduction histidine kinase